MRISNITQQVKRTDRYSVFIDEKYSFSLSENGLLQANVRVGQEVTEVELETLKDAAKSDNAYSQALSIIVRRPRSEWEVRDYLKRKKYVPELIEEITARLTARGFINDEDFARRWVESRRLLKSTSKRRLTMELRQKRVADDIVRAVLDEDQTNERSVLRELIDRKRQQSRYQDGQKLMAYLVRQGFNYDDVKSVLDDNLS